MPTPVALRRAAAAADTAWPRRPRSLAHELVESLGDRIRDGRLAAGEKLPTEAEIMAAHGVSRDSRARGAVEVAGGRPGAHAARHRHLRRRPGRGGAVPHRAGAAGDAGRRDRAARAAHRRRDRSRGAGGAAAQRHEPAPGRARRSPTSGATSRPAATRWRPTSASTRHRAGDAQRPLRRPDGRARGDRDPARGSMRRCR
ncbi:MAG: GntR family transcriptional regulator [Rubrivivax sp.]